MICKKILVAYNESEQAKKALAKAMDIARTDPSISIDVLYAIDVPQTTYLVGDVLPILIDSMQNHGEQLMTEAKKALASIDNPTRTFIETGRAFHVILDHAAKHGNDLIVMGSRGLSGFREFLGSVSHYVVQHSPVPVLIIK
jgi:nucleotide-binding universal stress UspA family protein